jgi:hypothetical protein
MNQYHDLAEAMRKGAALRPQCFGSYFMFEDRDGKMTPIESCALGAAYEGETGEVNGNLTLEEMLRVFPDIAGKGCMCSSCGESHTVCTMVVHLNDTHKWTREQIASWLDGLQVQP